MHNSKLLKWKIVANVLFLALLVFVNSASAGLIMTGAYQQSATSFTPTWTVAPSLISGMSPSNQVGNFTANGTTPGVSALTDGAIGPVSSSANNIYANCGSGAGQTLTYVLPAQTYGYNLTNITVYSGWANGGRVGQGYTVLYSTVANPGSFIWLTNVSYAAGFSGNNPQNPISIQVQLSDSAGGVIASSVAAVKFDFTDPAAPADENGGSGYSEITVQGTVATSVPTPMVSITTSNENGASPFTPTWTAETPDLIAGSLPSSSAGNFDADGSEGGLSVLTDGSVGVAGTKTTVVSCGASGGTSLVYTLTNSVNGSDVTNIVVYSMWGDSGRDGQYYILSYSSVLAPATFIPITTVYYLPLGNSGAQANRVAIFNPTGAPLATNVSRLKFDFAGPPGASSFNNGWQGYSEIVVQGTNSQALQSIGVGGTTLSPYPVVAPGTSVTASMPVIGPSPYFYQWRTDGGSGGALTNIPGATTSSNLVINTTGFAPGNYQYALLVSNNVSSVTSSVVVLTISQPNEISGVIGVKFGFTGGYATSDAPYPADNAGVASGQLVPPSYQPLTTVANWNDLMAPVTNGAPSSAKVAAIDQTWNITEDAAGNALSGVTLTPSGFDDGWYSGGTECPDGRLLYDCWKFNTSNGQTDTGGKNYATLTISGLPASTYDVYLYVNNDNGNYWGNAEANGVIAIGTSVDQNDGFNGADSDPCDVNPPLHTAGGFGNPANYVKMPYVATSSGNITITVVLQGGDFGVSGVELVPSPDLTLIQDTLPTYAETVVGDQVVFSGAFSNTPPVNLKWVQVSGSVTNIVNTGVANVTNNGVVTSTLTLNNVQTSSTGTYQLEGVNAANSLDYALSSAVLLNVSNTPAVAGDIIVDYAAQTGAEPFYPAWTVNTTNDLVFGFPDDGSEGSGTAGTVDAAGSFIGLNNDDCNGDPAILSDGILGDSKATLDACGTGGAGEYVIYNLQTNSSPLGFDINNIQVYGGWTDAGRVDQEYQVLYATVANPTNFVSLVSQHYLPADPSGSAEATRTMVVSTNGLLAHNVSAVEINWNITPQYLHGYAGYSEVVVHGTNSAQLFLTAPTISSVENVGGNLIVTGSGGYPPGAAYLWLSTTNLNPPIQWVTNSSGNLDGTGSFSNSVPINPSQPANFFQLEVY